MRNAVRLAVLLACLVLAPTALAQDEPADPTGAAVEIIWPPPVTEVWGVGDVIGSAAVPGMDYYYLEYLELNPDLSIPENAPWIPVTVAIEQPVFNGALATLDTTSVPDGLYALRLVVNMNDGSQFTDIVQPVRVNNARFDAVIERIIEEALAGAEVTPEPTAEPTAVPTVPPNTDPTLTTAPGLNSANVRRCDIVDNNACPPIGFIQASDTAAILGVSSNGTGWFLIRLPSGLEGWISPTVVATTGNLGSLPILAPPPPLPPPPPPAQAVVQPNGISIAGGTVCNVPFNVQINVANTGNAVSQAGQVVLQDVNIRTGEVTFTGYGSFPAINPGGNFVAVVPVTTTAYYNETHELRASIGSAQVRIQYPLLQGSCGVQPTPPPPPPPAGLDFGPNQCFVVLTSPTNAYSAPGGSLVTQVAPRAFEARRVEQVGGVLWYALDFPDLGRVWLTGIETQGGCGLATPR